MKHSIQKLKDAASDAEMEKRAFMKKGNGPNARYWEDVRCDYLIAIALLEFLDRPVDVQIEGIKPPCMWKGSFTDAAGTTICHILKNATDNYERGR